MATKQATKETGLFEAIQQFCQDKSLDKDLVYGVIRDSLLAAYRKKVGLEAETDDRCQVEFGSDNKNEIIISVLRDVVEGKTTNPLEISLEDAVKIDPKIEVGNQIRVFEKPQDLSRVLSSQAKQMVFQRLRDMEKELLYQEYKSKEGELTHGYFQRWKKDIMSIDLGKVEGIMLKKDQNPGEKYRQGDRLKAIISRVELRPREPMPVITLSRASGDFVKKLFEMEIPEVYDGIVEIRDVARIPSYRTKVVVTTSKSDVDPVGACVGMKGVRIQAIVRELGNERIDIVLHSDEPSVFIANAISPAKPVEVHVDRKRGDALVIVPDESLSLAIGINGSNVKLVSQLSGFKIDIKTVSQYNQELASPEAREKLDRLFNAQQEAMEESEDNYNQSGQEEEEEDSGYTPLSEIPGLTPRIVGLLEAGGIKNVETLLEFSQEELSKISGIGKTTAEQILRLLRESIEWVEEG
ncbi:transcription termination/antitermination protein NusA [Leptospira levettii]|uniref:Transcription termination/antitermination protein NusA n=3 Tax=Leptospira TaxID=171 RepID=A0A2N0AXI0_9LEPT|nr:MULTISPECIES: transcription termination factor NusA [Leptospira]PKA24974.1 transcription termination/antitermination protein NusA [Leptospira sp. mixed culture ATI2-C-A1]MCG6148731.1 transcription termination factor NusA [Leptospira levettii]MCW7467590.1 transcription termination factor NusA [Leptospira levettii]MCW7472565.1 transcription termination factor NusA [Leptospira levettii]MCW7498379.1 transcription termination factor NusA [Leptospira levettii]